MDAWAVIVAGGTGSRFGSPKQFADLAGRPVLDWSLETARKACAGVVLVLPAGPTAQTAQAVQEWDVDATVTGGASRSESVRAGLAAVPESAAVIAVHDAARPLARLELWQAVIDAVRAGADAAIPAVPLSDTVKRVGSDGHLQTLDRSSLVATQTPQAFRAESLRAAHRGAPEATDDASLVEALGGRVELIATGSGNIKITEPHDLVVAAALLEVGE